MQSVDGNVTFENDAGSERMRVTDAGNVGIGTTDPASRLTVQGNIRMTAGRSLISDAELIFSPSSTEAVRITSGGDVGIGTTTPASLLDVNGNMDLQGSLDMHQGSILNYYGSQCPDGEAIRDVNNDGSFECVSVTGGETANLYVNETGDNMTGALNMTGNNINGVNNLAVSGRITDSGAVRYDSGQFTAAGSSGYAFAGDTDTAMQSPASDVLAFQTGASERVRIDGSGNVGIGTSSPGRLLTVAGDAQVQGDLDVWGEITNTDVNNLNVNGSILPPAGYDGSFDLGNGSRRWRNAYIGSNLYDGDANNFFETGSLGAGQRVSDISSDGTISTSTISHDNLDSVTYNDHHGVGNAIAWDGSNNIEVAADSIDDAEVANNGLDDSSIASGAITATNNELASGVAGSGIGYASGALTVSTGSTIDVVSDNVVVAADSIDDGEVVDDGLNDTSLAANAVTASGSELDPSVAGNQLSLNSGALDVEEGAGSGLNADQVDGHDASDFLELDGSDSMNGTLDTGGNNVALNGGRISNDGQSEGIAVDNSGQVGVGTSSPSSTMEVDGSFNEQRRVQYEC